ncbi:MAG: transcription antitermination factor NusB [Lacipirellulaceae bacterium]
MSRRTRAREVALQVLFQDDLNPDPINEEASLNKLGAFLGARLREEDLRDFAKGLVLGVKRNQQELDELLEKHAENWTLRRMAATDRNLMRLAAYEIRFTETPPNVAIDEAVELAKRFGAKQSSQFVNGILDKLIERNDE